MGEGTIDLLSVVLCFSQLRTRTGVVRNTVQQLIASMNRAVSTNGNVNTAPTSLFQMETKICRRDRILSHDTHLNSHALYIHYTY